VRDGLQEDLFQSVLLLLWQLVLFDACYSAVLSFLEVRVLCWDMMLKLLQLMVFLLTLFCRTPAHVSA
jgi:hypothetical protein